jgi:hypothetical protein
MRKIYIAIALAAFMAATTIGQTTKTAWKYEAVRDEMTDKQIKTAAVESENTFAFKFPYNGYNKAILMLKMHPRFGKSAAVAIIRGQITSKTVMVRFDDEAPMYFATGEAESGRTNVVFIEDYAKFVSRMRKATKVLVEFTVYGEGRQTARFNVSGFDPFSLITPSDVGGK